MPLKQLFKHQKTPPLVDKSLQIPAQSFKQSQKQPNLRSNTPKQAQKITKPNLKNKKSFFRPPSKK